jgi:hypothetical protein
MDMIASNFTDPQNERVILLAVGGLVLLAVLVVVGTVVWWRSTKSEHPVLAPLEVMSTRKFEKADYTDRRRVLDEVRPAGAGGPHEEQIVSEVIDLDAAAAAPLPDPAELAEDPLTPEGPSPEPVLDAEPAVEPEPVVEPEVVVEPASSEDDTAALVAPLDAALPSTSAE